MASFRRVPASPSEAGGYEQQRYDAGLRAWRRRVLPRVRWLVFPVFAACLLYAFLGPATKLQFIAGLLAGGVFAVYLWVRDEPPAHVQRHLEGARGERATAKALTWIVGPVIRLSFSGRGSCS